MYKEATASTVNGEILKAGKVPILTTLHCLTGDCSQCTMARKIKEEIRGIRTGQENENFIICREHKYIPRKSEECTEKLLSEGISKFRQVTGDSIQCQQQ